MADDKQKFPSGDTLGRSELEEGQVFAPRFGPDGLLPAVAADVDSGEVLMLAWMNAEALERSLDTGEAWYWSRSRNALWHKGATSGQIQKIIELRVDCDQDSILLRVRTQREGACHVGYRSCFYRSLGRSDEGMARLKFEEREKVAK